MCLKLVSNFKHVKMHVTAINDRKRRQDGVWPSSGVLIGVFIFDIFGFLNFIFSIMLSSDRILTVTHGHSYPRMGYIHFHSRALVEHQSETTLIVGLL